MIQLANNVVTCIVVSYVMLLIAFDKLTFNELSLLMLQHSASEVTDRDAPNSGLG